MKKYRSIVEDYEISSFLLPLNRSNINTYVLVFIVYGLFKIRYAHTHTHVTGILVSKLL